MVRYKHTNNKKTMKIKTIGDLRNLIEDNDNNIVIGEVSLTFKDGEDIDVHFHGSLVQWYSKDNADTVLLNEARNTVSSDVEKGDKAQKENRELKEQIEELEKKGVEATLAVGKVEAYEKMLIGRGVTISA